MNRDFPKPLEPSARIIEADIVRGFALFGVLLVNMYGFGADSIAWDSSADQLASRIIHIFFDSKSWTLFCILFGFGFAVQRQRFSDRNFSFLHLRRMAVLFAFGAAHTLLYDGDILVLYAELGVLLLLVWRVPTRWLLVLAMALLLVFPVGHLLVPDREYGEGEYFESPAEARIALEETSRTDIYATGSLVEIISFNATAITASPVEDFNWADSGLAAFAMFLLGLSIGRSGIVQNIPGNTGVIARTRNLGLGIGLTAMAAEQLLTHTAGYAVYLPSDATPGVTLAGDLLFTIATVALALGYAATLVLAAQTRRGGIVLAPLAGVGRMALTVYLTQTVLFTTLFYGYGFGQAYRMGPVSVTALAIIFFSAQILACRWWLSRYRMGPAEWLWRSVTYLKWQPLLVEKRSVT